MEDARPSEADRTRRELHAAKSFGERAADRVAAGMGSWTFIIWQSAAVGVWVLANIVGWWQHWDPYPFILLNLLFSVQAAYAAPIIMMSQNRQSAKDRQRDDLEAQEVDLLFRINERQLEILELLQARLVPEAHSEQQRPHP